MIQKIASYIILPQIVLPHIIWLTFIATPIGGGHWGSTPPSVQDFLLEAMGKEEDKRGRRNPL